MHAPTTNPSSATSASTLPLAGYSFFFFFFSFASYPEFSGLAHPSLLLRFIFLCIQHSTKLLFFCQCHLFYLSSSLLWWFSKVCECFMTCARLVFPILLAVLASFKQQPVERLFADFLRHAAGSFTTLHDKNFYFYITRISWKVPLL